MQQTDKKLAIWGSPFQMILIVVFLLRTFLFSSNVSSPPVVIQIIGLIGMAMFGWCLYSLYLRRRRLTELITTGIFRYTRHPMYTGLLLMDLEFWFIEEYNFFFFVSTILLYTSVVIAAYLQEKETVARFGSEAIDYYGRTPRLIVMYPFCH